MVLLAPAQTPGESQCVWVGGCAELILTLTRSPRQRSEGTAQGLKQSAARNSADNDLPGGQKGQRGWNQEPRASAHTVSCRNARIKQNRVSPDVLGTFSRLSVVIRIQREWISGISRHLVTYDEWNQFREGRKTACLKHQNPQSAYPRKASDLWGRAAGPQGHSEPQNEDGVSITKKAIPIGNN